MDSLNPSDDQASITPGVASPDGGGALKSAIAAMLGDHSGLAARIRILEHTYASGHARTRIRVHYLAFRDGKPTLDALVEALEPKLVGFCLPRTEINETLGQIDTLTQQQVLERLSALAGRARRLFIKTRAATGRSGEAGELLLYLLTEWVLAAPQLIAKMSLKTNSQMPVHGSDGIHIRYDEAAQTVLLFWGEAKVHQSINKAIDAAATSMATFFRDQLAAEIVLVKAHHHMADLSSEAREALLSYLDPYSEKSNSRKDISTCLIMFDFDGALEQHAPENRETAFRAALLSAIEAAIAEFDAAATSAGIDQHNVELFFLPVPSVDDFRRTFQKLIGWPE
ncbi:DUF1837 domain-containing protein [Hyphomicrobium sp. 1Nfss2.1]|uniref:HamA C-terminal domain-containing protein n=1 Tax=Hyphomicrobium sp. 1Nfss2.1 TaxID=3413936 RepID=UPI003C7D9B73